MPTYRCITCANAFDSTGYPTKCRVCRAPFQPQETVPAPLDDMHRSRFDDISDGLSQIDAARLEELARPKMDWLSRVARWLHK